MARSVFQPRLVIAACLALVVALGAGAPMAAAKSKKPKVNLPGRYKGTISYTAHALPTPKETWSDTYVTVSNLKLKAMDVTSVGRGSKRKYGLVYTAVSGTVTVRRVLSGTCTMDATATFAADEGDATHQNLWLSVIKTSPGVSTYRGWPIDFRTKSAQDGTANCDGVARVVPIDAVDIFNTRVLTSSSSKKISGKRHADYDEGQFQEWSWNLKGY
jgi:hypothetical protein